MTNDERPMTNDYIDSARMRHEGIASPSSFVLRPSSLVEGQLLDTQRAFDSVAADYDGPKGNNALIQRMRETVWRTLTDTCSPGARLLDLGCGTGIDALELARRGYVVRATDWSPQMVERTRMRAADAGLSERVTTTHLGLQELDRLRNPEEGKGGEQFDGIYSNF